MATVDHNPPEKRKRIAGFFFGILLALLPIAAGLALNPSPATDFTAGRYQLLAIALCAGFTTGHYLGLAIGAEQDVNLCAAIGAFLTISLAVAVIAYTGFGFIGSLGAIAVLGIALFLLILGHYSGILASDEEVSNLATVFAEQASPAFYHLFGC